LLLLFKMHIIIIESYRCREIPVVLKYNRKNMAEFNSTSYLVQLFYITIIRVSTILLLLALYNRIIYPLIHSLNYIISLTASLLAMLNTIIIILSIIASL